MESTLNNDKTKEILKKVKRIEIKARRLSSNLFGGEYQSAFKGRGMSFSEVRTYSYGDDIRFIDWNVTAKTGIPHVKIFEEERELTVMIVADVSASTYFGTNSVFKSELMAEVAALIAFSAIQNNDKVGLITFHDKVRTYMAPQKGRNQVVSIIKELIEDHPAGSTDIGEALKYLNNVIKKKCVVFFLSDFMTSDYTRSIQIAAKKFDLIGIHLTDTFELNPQDIGLIRAIDPETQAKGWIDLSDKRTRNRIYAFYKEQIDSTRNLFRKCGASYINIGLKKDYATELHYFFRERM